MAKKKTETAAGADPETTDAIPTEAQTATEAKPKTRAKKAAPKADKASTPEPAHEHEHVHGPDCDHGHDHDHAHEDDEPEPRIEPINLELEDLTPEGKARAEQRLKRAIPDIAYTVKSTEARRGAVSSLTIEVDRQAYLNEQTGMLKDLAKDVVLPGFRKGMAPIKLLQLRMGEDAARSTMAALATNALRQQNAKENYNLVAKPRIVDYNVPPGQEPVSFVVEIEKMPEIELKDYTGISVDVEDRAVTDEQVEQRLEQLRRQNAVVETAAAGATIDETDTITIKTQVVNELGEELSHMSQPSRVVYNYKQDLPESIAAEIEGKKVGDTIEADVPAEVTNRKGEKIIHNDHWKVEILEIKKTKLPELDDEFAKDLGEHETLAALRTKLRDDLTHAETDRQTSEAFGKLLRAIVEKNPFDTPRSLIAHRQYDLIMQDQYQLQRMGLRLDQVVTDTDKYLHDQRASADEMVKIQMVSAALAKKENLIVSDEDVDKEIAVVAEQTGRKPLAVRARLEAQKQLQQFRDNVARKKISDWLIANNKVNKVAPAPAEEEPAKKKKK